MQDQQKMKINNDPIKPELFKNNQHTTSEATEETPPENKTSNEQ